MIDARDAGVRLVSPGIRRLTIFISFLAFVVGPLLFALPDRTDSLFAWTINPPLTAAFLGACYCTALVLEVMAARERTWALARVFYPGMITFTSAALLATILHLSRFHFGSAGLIARGTAWAWLVIYLLAPPVMVGLLVLQMRRPGSDLLGTAPLPVWCRTALLVQAGVLILVGTVLFVAPEWTAPGWPWALTPLTARACGAWMLGLGVSAGWAARENDWARARLAFLGNLVVGVLQLIALLRFAGSVRWDTAGAWIYTLALVCMAGFGLAAWVVANRAPIAGAPRPLQVTV